jgi:phosphatidate cytidylyltransferase
MRALMLAKHACVLMLFEFKERCVLRARLWTALVLLIFVLSAIVFLPPPFFSLLLFAIMAYGMWEWTALAGLHARFARAVAVVLWLLAAWGAFAYLPWSKVQGQRAFLFAVALLWCWAALAIVAFQCGLAWRGGFRYRGFSLVFGGLVLLAAAWVMALLRHADQGIFWLLLAFCVVWGSDSVAFFVGRTWGKHLLASQVSPKKTWEGVYGAWCGSVLVAVIAWSIQCMEGHILWQASAFVFLLYYTVLAWVTSCFCLVGDLLESLLKRQQGMKDSGHFLPGHGGLLDRIDAMLAALPVFWLIGHHALSLF